MSKPFVSWWLCGVLIAVLAASCTSLLGDDFEVGGGTGGGTSTAIVGGMGGAGGPVGGGGTGVGGGSGGEDPCGNGEPDEGETCDGDCPEECIDPDLCTDNVMTGTPDACNVECAYPETVVCRLNDGCCPSGCHTGNDNDCYLRVLIIAADPNGITAMRFTLGDGAPPPFGAVADFEASSATPTATDLANYESVLLYTTAAFDNPTALGDALADFHDAGGRVVVANGANCTQFAVGGRFASYLQLLPGAIDPNADTLGTVDEPQSPLMVGVSDVPSISHCVGSPAAGAHVVAHHANGDPLVVRGDVGGRQRVDLNLALGPAAMTGDVRVLVWNALLYQ